MSEIENERQRLETMKLAVSSALEQFRAKVPDTAVPMAARAFLELPDGTHKARQQFTDTDTIQATAVIRRDLKRAVHGLAPLFGEDFILALCAEVMSEDYDPEGYQTPSHFEHELRNPFEGC
ncbi:hypothetical protein GU700_11030 [Methylobacterium sp. NI91]|nr:MULTISPECIES: hypothetical protein [unclassified Methylobacterium]QIJ75076.1 hypothetical protein CLZ_11030 [Methylobacterium sp. CLZ]QIJ79980.1 hypothetical protein GU700_11030 [Methylobacterium sp. NI91]